MKKTQKKYLDYKILLKNDFECMEKTKFKLSNLDKEIQDISKDIKSMEERLPKLEKEKKNMVAARNFKVLKVIFTFIYFFGNFRVLQTLI